MGLKNTTAALVLSFGSTEGQLVRVEVLVLFSTLTWLLLELLGSYRRQNSNGIFRLLVWAVHTLSTVLAPYTIGLLQAGPFGDQTFVLWGVILLLIQVNSNSLSVYSIQDIGQRKSMLVQQVSQIFLVLWLILNGTGGNKSYSATGWIFWIYTIILTFRKFRSLDRASKKGGLVKYSKVVADYMVVEHHLPQDVEDPILNLSEMKGYRYIFSGDEELAHLLPTSPEYRVKVTNDKLVTIDFVWGWIEIHDFKYPEAKEYYKESTLSHTLFKLLKRRFCGYPLGEAGLQKTLDFVLDRLLSERGNYVRAFRIIEVELSFQYDFFYTRMDSTFLYFLWGLIFMSTAIVWNSVSGAFSKHHHRSNLQQIVNGTDVIHCVTIVLLASLIFAILVTTGFTPDRHMVVSTVYDNLKLNTIRGTQRDLGWLDKNKRPSALIRGTWERKLGQYCLLLNFTYDPWNVQHYLSLGLVDATRKGQKAGKKIKLAEEVIIRVLSRFKQNSGKLDNGQAALARYGLVSELSWAHTLPTHIHTILVWHIGTTICQNEVYPEGHLDPNCLLAKSLSEYCAYLVAFVPDMMPDHGYDTQRVFDAVVVEARKHLAGCETLSERCQKLKMGLQGGYDNTILGMGAKLGRQLMELVPDEARRWKVLADFWEDFILFLAPSDNADIHAEMLAAGGEFMTHLWALLTHAGILERPSSSSGADPLGESDGITTQYSGIPEQPNSSSGVNPLGWSDGTTAEDSGILERPSSASVASMV
ncbi:unnamed protein product [Alopecurus aequalis]